MQLFLSLELLINIYWHWLKGNIFSLRFFSIKFMRFIIVIVGKHWEMDKVFSFIKNQTKMAIQKLFLYKSINVSIKS